MRYSKQIISRLGQTCSLARRAILVNHHREVHRRHVPPRAEFAEPSSRLGHETAPNPQANVPRERSLPRGIPVHTLRNRYSLPDGYTTSWAPHENTPPDTPRRSPCVCIRSTVRQQRGPCSGSVSGREEAFANAKRFRSQTARLATRRTRNQSKCIYHAINSSRGSHWPRTHCQSSTYTESIKRTREDGATIYG